MARALRLAAALALGLGLARAQDVDAADVVAAAAAEDDDGAAAEEHVKLIGQNATDLDDDKGDVDVDETHEDPAASLPGQHPGADSADFGRNYSAITV